MSIPIKPFVQSLDSYTLALLMNEALFQRNNNPKFQHYDNTGCKRGSYSIQVYGHLNYCLDFDVNDEDLLNKTGSFKQVLVPLLNNESLFELVDDTGKKVKSSANLNNENAPEVYIKFNSPEVFQRVEHLFTNRKILTYRLEWD